MLRLAFKHGIDKGVPAWVTAVELAEAGWGYPEDIMQRRGSLRWAARRAFYLKQKRWVEDNR